jgi:hypothetical protein
LRHGCDTGNWSPASPTFAVITIDGKNSLDFIGTSPLCPLELSTDPTRRQERWREFLLGEDPKEAASARQVGVLGAADFREATAMQRSRAAGRGRGRPRKTGVEG